MLKKIDCYMERFLDIFTIMNLVLLVLIVVLQIGCRLLKMPMTWTEEIARYVFLVLTFFGATQATREQTHIRIDIFARRFKGKSGTVLKIFVEILVAGFLCMFLIGAISSIQINPNLGAIALQWFKITWIYEALLVSGFIMLIYTISHIVNLVRGKE